MYTKGIEVVEKSLKETIALIESKMKEKDKKIFLLEESLEVVRSKNDELISKLRNLEPRREKTKQAIIELLDNL